MPVLMPSGWRLRREAEVGRSAATDSRLLDTVAGVSAASAHRQHGSLHHGMPGLASTRESDKFVTTPRRQECDNALARPSPVRQIAQAPTLFEETGSRVGVPLSCHWHVGSSRSVSASVTCRFA